MKSQVAELIIEIIKKGKKVRPDELHRQLGITPAAIHRHLKKLILHGKLVKTGKPPLVFYTLPDVSPLPPPKQKLPDEFTRFLDERYLYINPAGRLLYGSAGFAEWAGRTNPQQNIVSLAQEYQKICLEAESFRNRDDLIEGTEKLRNTFPKTWVDHVFYQDFYSLPKFGKTKLGQLVLHGKQAQDTKIIAHLAGLCKPHLLKLIRKTSADALAWVPHSLPRKIPFLKELKKQLNLALPEVQIVKAYQGEIPMAQKSLSKLEERIANARETLFVKSNDVPYRKVLLIDDALGSGATINELAGKLKSFKPVRRVFAFVLVGSYKGFEVIKEI